MKNKLISQNDTELHRTLFKLIYRTNASIRVKNVCVSVCVCVTVCSALQGILAVCSAWVNSRYGWSYLIINTRQFPQQARAGDPMHSSWTLTLTATFPHWHLPTRFNYEPFIPLKFHLQRTDWRPCVSETATVHAYTVQSLTSSLMPVNKIICDRLQQKWPKGERCLTAMRCESFSELMQTYIAAKTVCYIQWALN